MVKPDPRHPPVEFELAPPVAIPRPGLPAPDTVRTDLPCVRCGYNLKTLSVAARCPECGLGVRESQQGDALTLADPMWLTQLAWAFGLGAGATVLRVVDLFLSTNFGARRVSPVVPLVAEGAAVAASVLGVWLLTTPEPRERYKAPALSVRLTLRLVVIVAGVGNLLLLANRLAGSPALRLTGGVLQIAWPVEIVLYYLYLRRMAERVPDDGLANQCNLVVWGFGGSLSVVLVGLFMAQAGIAACALFTLCPALAGVLVFGVWACTIDFRFLLLFRYLLPEARRNLEEHRAGG